MTRGDECRLQLLARLFQVCPRDALLCALEEQELQAPQEMRRPLKRYKRQVRRLVRAHAPLCEPECLLVFRFHVLMMHREGIC